MILRRDASEENTRSITQVPYPFVLGLVYRNTAIFVKECKNSLEWRMSYAVYKVGTRRARQMDEMDNIIFLMR